MASKTIPKKTLKKYGVQFERYFLVAICGFALNIFFLYIFKEHLKFDLLWAVALSYLIEKTSNFLINEHWTFAKAHIQNLSAFARSLCIALGAFLIVMICMQILANILGINYLIARVITAVFSGGFSYLMDSIYTFKVRILPR